MSMDDVARFEVGEPDFDTPFQVRSAAKEALDRGWTKYTSSSGVPELREAIHEFEKRKLGAREGGDTEVCVTLGGTNGLYLALSSILSLGDEVLIPEPGWPQYRGIVALAGGEPVPYRHSPDSGFAFDAEALASALSPSTKAIILNSPNNPTGRMLSKTDLSDIGALVRNRDLWIISDEVYEHIVFDQREHVSPASLDETRERTVVVSSFSKTYAMTGWRVGYAIGPKRLIEAISKLQVFVNTCPSAVSQAAALEALSMHDSIVPGFVNELAARRKLFGSILERLPRVGYAPPEGAFYALCDFRSVEADDIQAARSLLLNSRVSCIPGSAFGDASAGFLRFSFACTPDEIEQGLERLENAVAEWDARRLG